MKGSRLTSAPPLIVTYPLPSAKMKGPAEIAHGPIFIGFVIKVFLYGILVLQGYIYYTRFKTDKPWMRIFVGLLILADTVNVIFNIIYLYSALIIHFADPLYLSRANWVFATDPALMGITTCAVQLFFAWRVKVLTSNIWLVLLVGITAIASGLSAVGCGVAVHFVPDFVDFQKFKVVVIIWLAAGALADVFITSALTWHLRKHKTGFGASDEVIDRIIRLTVQTGLLQALLAIIDLLFFLLDPSGTHLIFNFILSKLYSNALLSSLNSRSGWKFSSTPSGQQSVSVVSQRGPVRNPAVVQVYRQEHVELDMMPTHHKDDFYSDSERGSSRRI